MRDIVILMSYFSAISFLGALIALWGKRRGHGIPRILITATVSGATLFFTGLLVAAAIARMVG